MGRPKTAFFDLACCEGCQLQFVNTGETLLDLVDLVDLVEFREAISETWPGTYDIAFVEGSVADDHVAERLLRIRERTTTLVAFGSCAAIGGVNGAKNALDVQEAGRAVYGDGWRFFPSGPTRAVPQVVPVEYVIPGCPVSIPELVTVLKSILRGLPYVVPDVAVCNECRMNENVCTFDRGVACLGPVTRAGCDSWCTSNGNVCYGCRGLVSNPNTEAMARAFEECGLSGEEFTRRMELYNRCLLEGEGDG
jgi:coenzyme F420-reducing hydrogenase gamma subunit